MRVEGWIPSFHVVGPGCQFRFQVLGHFMSLGCQGLGAVEFRGVEPGRGAS